MNERVIDLVVVGLYLVLITGIGLWVGRRTSNTSEGYFLGGRSFNWVLVGISIYATNISAASFIGGAGLAFNVGFAAANPELLGGFFLSLSAMFMIPLYLRARISTLPQFLELRFNRTAKLFYGCVNVIRSLLNAPIYAYVSALAILGLFGFEINTGNILICSATVACTIGLYVIYGGLKSVVVTDVIQVVIMLAGGITVVLVGLYEVGGIGALYESVGSEKFELLLPYESEQFAWDAVLFGNGTASAIYAICAIGVLQRVLGAKSVDDAQKGMLLGGFLKMFSMFLFALPGLIALALYPGVAPDEAYTHLARETLPIGLRSLILAAMVAALMSSEDSQLNATASVIALDIVPSIWKRIEEKRALLVGKIAVAFKMIFGVLAAPFIMHFDAGVLELILKVAGFLILPAGVCFIFGRFSRRTNGYGAVATLFTGMVLGIYYVLCSSIPDLRHLLPDIVAETQFYRVYPFLFLFLASVMLIVSYLTPAPSEEKLDCLNLKEAVDSVGATKKPLHKRYGFWMTLYLIFFFGMYAIF